ncbi:hypothetical protein LCGC14_1946270 [marine sediment metagenome]|uniref:Uncharacterized protein n=1 Tax=marine sediment metagenome TaxID=412755 RepID=A0A0F9HX52_9ZZZZ
MAKTKRKLPPRNKLGQFRKVKHRKKRTKKRRR